MMLAADITLLLASTEQRFVCAHMCMCAGKRVASDRRWLQQLRLSGTVADKLDAMTLLLQASASLFTFSLSLCGRLQHSSMLLQDNVLRVTV